MVRRAGGTGRANPPPERQRRLGIRWGGAQGTATNGGRDYEGHGEQQGKGAWHKATRVRAHAVARIIGLGAPGHACLINRNAYKKQCNTYVLFWAVPF